MKSIISLMLLAAWALSANAASLRMPVVFADHMVLQRDQAVPV